MTTTLVGAAIGFILGGMISTTILGDDAWIAAEPGRVGLHTPQRVRAGAGAREPDPPRKETTRWNHR